MIRLKPIFNNFHICIFNVHILYETCQFAGRIVNACSVLHNIAIQRGIPNDEIYANEDDIEDQEPVLHPINRERGELIRDEVVEMYFTN